MRSIEDTSGPSIEGRPWRRATAWLVALSTFFYLSYGFANWLTSQRDEVPAVVFGWERAIPFLAWTIVPYWSTHVLFAVSFYLCRRRAELDNHAKRLLTAQLVAVACFILFPLKITFDRPHMEEALGLLFEPLRLLDMPFNQAPSLHIATTTILLDLFARVLPRWMLPVLAAWSLLVAISVLTTYQHHFIDIPAGILLGVLCVWLWPAEGASRLAHSLRVPQRFFKRVSSARSTWAILPAKEK